MGLSIADSAVRIDIDLLTTGHLDILIEVNDYLLPRNGFIGKVKATHQTADSAGAGHNRLSSSRTFTQLGNFVGAVGCG